MESCVFKIILIHENRALSPSWTHWNYGYGRKISYILSYKSSSRGMRGLRGARIGRDEVRWFLGTIFLFHRHLPIHPNTPNQAYHAEWNESVGRDNRGAVETGAYIVCRSTFWRSAEIFLVTAFFRCGSCIRRVLPQFEWGEGRSFVARHPG